MKTETCSTRPLRLLLLNNFFYPDAQGGTATATGNIARALQDRGDVQVSVVTGRHSYRDGTPQQSSTDDWNGIKIYRVLSPHWLRESVKKRLLGNVIFTVAVSLKALSLPRPDAVIVTTSPITLPFAARLLHKLRRVPYFYVVYDLDPDRSVALKQQGENSRPVRILRKLQKGWLSSAAAVISIGRCMTKTLIDRYGLDPSKVHVVEVGANPDIVSPGGKQTNFRRAHKLSGFLVLYSGNLGQYHDFDPMLDAAESLRDAHPEITFIVVGNGHKKALVEHEINRRGLTNIRMFPFVPQSELADLLASADVHFVTLEAGMEGLCVPSKFYTCLASGRPILALVPEECEVAYVVQEAACGVRVEPGDAKMLANSLVALAAEPEAIEEMGCRARRIFEDRFTTTKTAQRLYETICRSTGRR